MILHEPAPGSNSCIVIHAKLEPYLVLIPARRERKSLKCGRRASVLECTACNYEDKSNNPRIDPVNVWNFLLAGHSDCIL